MTLISLTTFIRITDANEAPISDGGVTFRFQNSLVSTDIAHNFGYGSESYSYLPFIYQGAAKNRSGDNLTASLLLPNSPIAMPYAVKAVNEKTLVRVYTCLMTDAFAVSKVISTEQWLAASMGYDPETIEISLSSAIDAVGAQAPAATLTTERVGHLPVTAHIQNR